MSFHPVHGATPAADGVSFGVWAPDADSVELVVETGARRGTTHSLQKGSDGHFRSIVGGVMAGDRYRYRVDGEGLYPDPASRFQPEGVHGPSEVVMPERFPWRQQAWRTPPLRDLVFHELHIGAFTPEGTFAAAAEKLPYLRDLGITAVELMPVADFPGGRNWGYDGVALFAPARCYGAPDDLRRLVDEAHRLGLAIFLDVVYNHLGPDGAYTAALSKRFFSRRHQSPWGAGLNFDGPHSAHVRRFFIENALHWIHEYRFDGLRLDAAHAIVDDSPRHFLAELAAAVRDSLEGTERRVFLVAEDHRNLAHMVRPEADGGWGIDAVWADDFHHQVRRHTAGDSDGYFADFTGATADIARTLRQGWFYCGQHAPHFGKPRGTDPSGLEPERFVVCIQNHDQVGNRAFGDRLHHAIGPAAYRAASALLLLAPQTPLLFMGQEWAAGSPFQYFTDHHAELGKLVTEGRRREFQSFRAFQDPASRRRIPDPQALSTFLDSQLRWDELEQEPHARTLALYRKLLAIRRRLLCGGGERPPFEALAPNEHTVVVRYALANGGGLLVVARLSGAGEADLRAERQTGGGGWHLILSTEEERFAGSPEPPVISPDGAMARFSRPGALVFHRSAAGTAA